MRKTALVTGGAGEIGQKLIPILCAAGYDVTSVDPRYLEDPKYANTPATRGTFRTAAMRVKDYFRACYMPFDVVIRLDLEMPSIHATNSAELAEIHAAILRAL